MHSFAATCGLTVTAVLGAENDFNHELQGFEQQCLENADPRVFLDAIMSADCSEAQGGAQHTETDIIPLSRPFSRAERKRSFCFCFFAATFARKNRREKRLVRN